MTDRTVLTGPTESALNERQLVDYTAFKKSFVQWLETIGKDTTHAEGYADETVRQTSRRIDQCYRWVWNENDEYTTAFTPDDATDYMNHLVCAECEYSNSTLSNVQKSIKRLFKWFNHEHNNDINWDSQFSFTSSSTNVRDYFTVDERRKIREAALEYGSIPAYNSLSSSERDEWKVHLAQRFEKPKRDVGKDDWDRANGWKIPSLVWTALDTGLRPIEVGRATVQWVDTRNKVLRIPKEDSSKNTDNWIVSITDRTAAALEEWLLEREHYDKYDGTDALWLTRQANPYSSSSLSYIVERICDVAEIPTENRQASFYSIRHSVGTFMARERGLKAAQSQLRHKSTQTTMQYDQVPVTDRRDALNKMG